VTQPRRIVGKGWWLALWLSFFILALVWRLPNLDAFGLSNDEGAHLMWARLALEGYPLYQETQAVQAPLFIESIGWAFRLGGVTIQSGRWVALVGFVLLAVTLSWLAHRVGGWPATLTTILLVGISPLIFTFSRLVMAEVPATAFAVLSIAWLLLFLERQSKLWLVGSGVALGASFLIKALNPLVLIPIALMLLIQPRIEPQPARGLDKPLLPDKCWKQVGLAGLTWGVGFCLPLILTLLFYEPAALYDQLVVFRADLRAAIPGSWAETWDQFELFIGSHWGFGLLALGGILISVLGVDRQVGRTPSEQKTGQAVPVALYNLIWVAWLVSGAVMLAWHTPLFPHHFIVLLPPLILLGAGSIPTLVALGPAWPQLNLRTRGLVVLLLLLVIGAALNGPAMVKANQETAAIRTGGREQEALRLLQAVSNPNDFVMGDSQLLIFMAGRRTPPPLGDVALVAIKAGWQHSDRMIGLTEAYQAPAVVQWSLRLPWLPDYLSWVEKNYLAHRVWDNDHIIYFGRRLPPDEPIPNEVSVRVGEALVLRGFQLDTVTARPGKDLNLKVYWQTEVSLMKDYTIFTQLLDSQGMLVAGRDSQPLGGHLPTSQWPVGEVVTDIVQLPLPANLGPGDYTLITGMYLLETLERLPVNHQGDYVNLTRLSLK
jgi:hypothetical protein